MLAPGEMFPSARSLDDEVQGTPMESVEHLGQYVFEMTQAKLKAMGGETAVNNEMDMGGDEEVVMDEDEVMLGAGEEGDDDPLHEHTFTEA